MEGAGKLLWGYYPGPPPVWVPLQVDVNGYVKVDMSAINLNDLGDVDVPAPTDGYVLYWNNPASRWQAKSLVPAALHNDYMAYAWMSGDLATQNNVEITVQLNTEVYDPGGNFDVANYRYKAPVAGYYVIIGNLSWDWSGMVADKPFYAKIYIGAAMVDHDVRHSAVTERLANKCASIQHLDADDYVYLHALQISGGNTPILSGDDQGQTFMQVFLVQAD